MKTPFKSDWFWLAARLFLGLVFAYAGFSKLMEPLENFRGALAQYEVIPYRLLTPMATVLPWLELTFGIFTMLGFATRLSSLALALFSLSFLIVLGSSHVLLGSFPISCGCFGEGGIHLSVRQVFVLDLVNFFLGLKLFRHPKKPLWSLDRLLGKA